MTYSIFVSHTNMDANLAERVTESLGEALEGRATLKLARAQIESGAQWKAWIKENIDSCDMVITIFTPEAVHKPWLYVEWAPFWLNDDEGKDFIVLLASGVKAESLISPMLDSQTVNLDDEASVYALLRALGKRVDPPLEDEAALRARAPGVVEAAARGRRADLGRSAERYADAGVELPQDDQEAQGVLQYFYEKGDTDTFRSLFGRLRHDSLRADVALWTVKKNDLAIASALCGDITASDHLCRVASGMIRAGHEHSPELRRVLDGITNNAEKRKLAVELLDRGMVDADVLRHVVGLMDNMAELRRVGMRLVERAEQTRPIFGEVVDKIARTNRTALRDVALAFVGQGTHRTAEFERLMDDLVAQKPTVAIPVLEALKESDPEMLPLLHERHARHGAGNAAVEWLRKELGPG